VSVKKSEKGFALRIASRRDKNVVAFDESGTAEALSSWAKADVPSCRRSEARDAHDISALLQRPKRGTAGKSALLVACILYHSMYV